MGLGGLFNTEEHSHSHYKPQYGNTRKKLHSSCSVKLSGEKLSDKMFLAKNSSFWGWWGKGDESPFNVRLLLRCHLLKKWLPFSVTIFILHISWEALNQGSTEPCLCSLSNRSKASSVFRFSEVQKLYYLISLQFIMIILLCKLFHSVIDQNISR